MAKSRIHCDSNSIDIGELMLTQKREFYSGCAIQTSETTSASTPKSGGTQFQVSFNVVGDCIRSSAVAWWR